MRIITPLLKLGLGGGAVYIIFKEGLFSNSQEETIKASKRIADSVPGVNFYLEKIPKFMSKEDMINYWNSVVNILGRQSCQATVLGDQKKPSTNLVPFLMWDLESVTISVSALASLPENSKEALKNSYSYLKDELKKQMQAPNQSK